MTTKPCSNTGSLNLWKQNYYMKRRIFKSVVLFLALSFAVCTNAQTNNERVYIQDLTVTPGGEAQCLTIALENGAHSDYTAFQFDVELPAGMEVAYYEDEAEVYIAEEDHVYPTRRNDHVVVYKVVDNIVKIRCYSATNKAFAKTSGALIDMYVVPTAYIKPGNVEIKLHNVLFAKQNENAGYKAETLTFDNVQVGDECNLTLNISASNKFSTAIFPFDVPAIPDGFEVYSCNSTNGENLVLDMQSSIKAYTPYIVYAPNGFKAIMNGTVAVDKYQERVTDGYLTGTVVPQEIGGGKGYYVMQNKGEGTMFYKVGDTAFAIPAGKCWLTIPQEKQSSAMFRLARNTTAIEEVNGEKNAEKVIYDLQGRKIKEITSTGIYIIDNSKTFVK